MNTSYLIGVAAAIMAGIAFNTGILIQKMAVMKASGNASLMRQLIRSPLWLAGFGIQFIVGMPLNMLAQTRIGPAIIPGLMAIGLAVLTIGAVGFVGEPYRLVDVVGISLVIAAVSFFGLSRLSVDVQSIEIWDPAFLLRLSLFTSGLAGLSVAFHIMQKMHARRRGILRMLNAGLLLSQSNLWLGVLMAFLTRRGGGLHSTLDLLSMAVASGIVFAGSMLGIAETQRALLVGEASKLIPIQYAPVQILPIAAYFIVFSLDPPTSSALPLALAGIVLVLSGGVLLARHQIFHGRGS